jgi:hypothetical protein
MKSQLYISDVTQWWRQLSLYEVDGEIPAMHLAMAIGYLMGKYEADEGNRAFRILATLERLASDGYGIEAVTNHGTYLIRSMTELALYATSGMAIHWGSVTNIRLNLPDIGACPQIEN